MRLYYLPYSIPTGFLFMVLAPVFRVYARWAGRYEDHLAERFGYVSAEALGRPGRGPRIWIHAVSLGEVKVAESVIRALEEILPGCFILLSTVTRAGRAYAEKVFGEKVPVIYAPVDVTGPVRRTLEAVRPHAMVFLETEIWPTWVRLAKETGARCALIHGRISRRSVRRYRKAGFFFRRVLDHFDAFSMISPADAERIRTMGADPGKTEINGSAKYDFSTETLAPAVREQMRRKMRLGAGDRVFIAGSTRRGEESMVLEAWGKMRREFPDLLLVMAPRHMDRIGEVCSMAADRGLAYHLWTDLREPFTRTAPVIIVDTLGDLFNIYSIGTLIFVGGSLVPLGGQNPLEPAAWGKPVLFGPHMENFEDAGTLLEKIGAAYTVEHSEEMAEKAVHLLRNPQALQAMGEEARGAVEKNRGAAMRHARVIQRVLESHTDRGTGIN